MKKRRRKDEEIRRIFEENKKNNEEHMKPLWTASRPTESANKEDVRVRI